MKENEKGQRTKRKHVGVERWWVAETSAGEDEECNSEKNGERKTPREEKKEKNFDIYSSTLLNAKAKVNCDLKF